MLLTVVYVFKMASVTQNPATQSQRYGPRKPKTVINVDNNTPMEISKLGSAAIKGKFFCVFTLKDVKILLIFVFLGGLDLSRAHILYEDLLKAQSSLVLFTGLHLMYLVTPYQIAEQVNPRKSLYYSLVTINIHSLTKNIYNLLIFIDYVCLVYETERKRSPNS